MCIRPVPIGRSEPERSERVVVGLFGGGAGHQDEANQRIAAADEQQQHQEQQQRQPRNYMDHFTKIKFRCDYEHNSNSLRHRRHWLSIAIEHRMFALFASLFECTFLLAAIVSALLSIVRPKLRNGVDRLVLLALPLMALLMPTVAMKVGAAGGNSAADNDGNRQSEQQQQQHGIIEEVASAE